MFRMAFISMGPHFCFSFIDGADPLLKISPFPLFLLNFQPENILIMLILLKLNKDILQTQPRSFDEISFGL